MSDCHRHPTVTSKPSCRDSQLLGVIAGCAAGVCSAGVLLVCGCAAGNLGAARSAMEMGAWDRAEVILVAAVQETPRDAEALYLLGETYYHQGKTAQMKESFDRSLSSSSKYERRIDHFVELSYIECHNKAQNALLLQPPQSYREALEQFQVMLLLKPDDQDTRKKMALCYILTDSIPSAVTALEHVTAASQTDIQAMDQLAGCYYREHRYEDCIRECDSILERQPEHHNALSLRALSLDESGDTEAAAEAYEKVLSYSETERPDLIFNLGLCYFVMGRYQDSINELTKIEDNESFQPQVLYLLGESYFGVYDYDTAEEYFRSVMRINGNFGDAKKYLRVIGQIEQRGD
jgi:tetratricopeptide (TPR) repeat protein